MKLLFFLLIAIFISSNCFASTTIDFNRSNGSIISGEFSSEGISVFTDGIVWSNRLEQDNTNVPGSITITFNTNQTVVRIEYIRHSSYSLDNLTLGVDYTTITAFDGVSGTGSIISSQTSLESGQLEVVGLSNIKSIQLTGVYDNYGHFNAFDNLFFDTDPPLPVELTSFSTHLINNIVELSWQTATEVNNYGFEIEKYYNKYLNNKHEKIWEKIGFVSGHGNSNSPKKYSFSDKLNYLDGMVEYRLKQIDIDGTFEYSHVANVELENVNNKYELEQNYPNPFNPNTIIRYSIQNESNVKLTVYDVLGNEIIELINGYQSAGYYSTNFEAKNLSSGVYVYKLEADNFITIKNMLLIK